MNFCAIIILVGTIFLTKARLCNSVETPPKEIINVAIKAVALKLNGMLESVKHPFVISNSPETKVLNMLEFIPQLVMLVKYEKIVLDNTISIITNANVITPPINRME